MPSPGSILLGTEPGALGGGDVRGAAAARGAARLAAHDAAPRRGAGPGPARLDRPAFDRAACAAAWSPLAAIQVGDLREGTIFSAAIGLALLFLWLAARGLIKGVRRWFPHGLPYLWRQGLANLYRPANQTVTVVLALEGKLDEAEVFIRRAITSNGEDARDGPRRRRKVSVDVGRGSRQEKKIRTCGNRDLTFQANT